MRKRLTQLFFIVITLLVLLYFNIVISVRSDDGIDQSEAVYYQPRDRVDVLFLGSSHVHFGVDTAILWQDYGIPAYDYSGADQPMWVAYHNLVEFFKRQHPKLVVLDMYSAINFMDPYQYDFILENYSGMRPSMNKLRMIRAGVEKERFWEYFPAFALYHDRILEVTTEDLLFPFRKRELYSSFKGYFPEFEVTEQRRQDVYETESAPISEKNEEYFQKIVAFTREQGCDLFVILIPYVNAYGEGKEAVRASELAEAAGCRFLDANYAIDEIGLDHQTDFYDESHLNYWGAGKNTHYLAGKMREYYELADRRSEEGYESWDIHAERIRAMAAAAGSQ